MGAWRPAHLLSLLTGAEAGRPAGPDQGAAQRRQTDRAGNPGPGRYAEPGPVGDIGKHAEVVVPQRVARPRVLGVRALNHAAGLLVLSRENFPDLDLTHRLPAPVLAYPLTGWP